MALFRWQEPIWQSVMAQRTRLPHALLITGEAGIGKRQFAEHLAQYWLCEAQDKGDSPCGQCHACHWFIEGHHPDFRIISSGHTEPKEESAASTAKKNSHWITIDAVRALQDFLHIGAHRGGMRVVLVYPAEMMNAACANALLKMLEEPPAGVVFLLVSHRWQRLLATIKSRCRRLAMPTPTEEVAVAWLESQGVHDAKLQLRHHGGAPLLANEETDTEGALLLNTLLNYLTNPKKYSINQLAVEVDKLKADTVDVIDCLQKWAVDSFLYQATQKIRYYPDYQEALAIRGQFGPKFWTFYDSLLEARRYAQHPLNQRLLMEKILYQWVDVLKEAYAQ